MTTMCGIDSLEGGYLGEIIGDVVGWLIDVEKGDA